MRNKWTIVKYHEIDSTNTYLKKNSEKYDHMTVVRANYQTQGRGQFDRTWTSESGKNLLCSILFKREFPFPSSWMNPIIVSTMIALLKEYGIEAYFKAPNDIYVQDHKIAGILMETKYENHHLQTFIVGIGLNVNQVNFPTELNATSMARLSQMTYDVEEILQRLLQIFDNHLTVGQFIYEEISNK